MNQYAKKDITVTENSNYIDTKIEIITKSLDRQYFKNTLKKLVEQNIQNANTLCNYKEIQTERAGSGKLIVIGTLTDSHPETIMIGVMIALGIPGLFPTALTLFIGNFAATIVGTRELIAENESKRKILQKWATVFIFVTIGGPIGYFLTLFLDEYYLSIVFSFAAGALMSFVTEELIPDAYRKVNWHIGLSACVGLFVSFAIFHFYH